MSEKPHTDVDYIESLTGKISKPVEANVEEIGERVKSIRNEKGISIAKLSELTGFNEQFLENIENNSIKPQLGTIIKLSKALDSAFSKLISGGGSKLYSITRKAEQKIISHSTSQTGAKEAYVFKSLAPEAAGRHMEALIVELAKINLEMVVHSGEEFIYALEGVTELTIDDKVFDLNPGDSAYYPSTMPHFITAKNEKATILAVMYSDT